MPPDFVPDNAFCIPITVGDDDIDAQGHASNVSVVRWFSRAAAAHSRDLGYDTPQYQAIGGMFVVRRHEIDYASQARAGDALTCWTWPSGLAKASAQRRHRLVRNADGALIAAGLNTWAWIDATHGRPRRIPDAHRRAFDPARFGA